MTRRRRVAVTGMGAVTGWGWGIAPLWQGLLSGKTAIRMLTRFDPRRHRTCIAAEVPDLESHRAPRRERLAVADLFALEAAREALAGARLDPREDPRLTGLYFGSSTGGMLEAEGVFARLLGVSESPIRIGELSAQQYNGPGDAVARAVGLTGPVLTLSSACTSATLALGAALDAVRDGEVDVALAGGSDSLCQLTYAGFNSLRSVAPEPSRPFRRDREGLSLGEGAGVMVLEPLDEALARGATPLAELVGAGSTCDAHHMTAPAPDGGGAARAIREALADARIEPAAIDFVDAHGTGTPLNDSAEARALHAVFGDRAAELPLAAPKGSHGHLLGSAGAVEAIATVLCLRHRVVHPVPAGGEVEAELAVRLVVGEPLPLPKARYGLSTNLAFGGSNAALIFRRFEETTG